MRLRTRLILALCYVAFIWAELAGLGRPWMRMLASVLITGLIMILVSEQRISRGTRDHTSLNIQR